MNHAAPPPRSRTRTTFLVVLAWIFLLLPAPAEPLKQRLDAKREAFLEKAPREKVEEYQAGIDAVSESGIYDRALKVGDRAPDFTLPDASGKEVKLSQLLQEGPVVLTWYRGGWCPYCNLALAALQETLPELREAGARLVAISPETPDHTADTTKANALGFTVLSDVGNQVAREYGLVFEMTPAVAEAMEKGFGLSKWNASDSGELPLAASYVIAPDGTISYAFLDADYRNRAEPARLVDALHALQGPPDPAHLVLQLWENVWNPPYDLNLVDRIVAKDFVLTSAGKEVRGREAFKDWIAKVQSQVKDIRLENLDLIEGASDGKVVSRWKASGRNHGLFGSEPDGRAIDFTGIAIWQSEDGKLTHNWVERSTWELYQAHFEQEPEKANAF